MFCFAQRFQTALLVLAIASVPGTCAAQGMPSLSSSTSPDGSRPQSTRVDFFRLMQSGGEAFLDLFRDGSNDASVADPKWNSADSPRAAVMTFLEAMNHVANGREEAWPRARRILGDISSVDDPRQAATDLLHVFDRLPALSAGTIPGTEMVRQQQISRYELFPRGVDSAFVYRVLDDSPAGAITLVNDGAEWQFSGQTVAGASELLDSLKKIPPRPRIQRQGALFLNTVEPTFTETQLTGWLTFLGALVAAGLLAWLAAWGVSKAANRFAAAGNFVIAPLIRGTRTALVIVILTFGLMTGSGAIHFAPSLSHLRWRILQTLFILAVIWLLVSLIELGVIWVQRGLVGKDNPYGRMLSTVIRRCVRFFAIVLLTVFVVQNVFQWNVTAVLGGLGILALAISLAAKDAVANLFGAMTIYANRPFVTGDWVRFDDQIGEVEDVSVQVTRIRLLSGEVWSVPNMRFVDRPVENLSMRKYLRRTLHVSLPYGTSVKKLKEARSVLLDVLSSEEFTKNGEADLDAHPPLVNFTEFGDYSLNLRVDHWYMMDADSRGVQRDTERGFQSYLKHISRVNTRIAEAFADHEIEFAFPTQTIELEKPEAA